MFGSASRFVGHSPVPTISIDDAPQPVERKSVASASVSSAPLWLRRTAFVMTAVFLWMAALAVPAQALAHPLPLKRPGVRVLPSAEMKRLLGKQAPANTVPQAGAGLILLSTTTFNTGSPTPGSWSIVYGTTTIASSASPVGWYITSFAPGPPSGASLLLHAPGNIPVGSFTLTYYVATTAGYTYSGSATNTLSATFSIVQPATSLASGSPFPWEAKISMATASGVGAPQATNTRNGNTQTSVPLVGWTQNGGLPIALALVHNSQSTQNTTLGPKWTHSYDLYGLVDGSGNFTIHWGDDLAYKFTLSSGVYSPPTGLYDSLVKNVDGTFTLTTKSQIQYHFNLSQRCDTIRDENGNQITLGYTGNLVTSITRTPPAGQSRSRTPSTKITGISDPLGRSWSIVYNGTTGTLQQVKLPLLAGQSAWQQLLLQLRLQFGQRHHDPDQPRRTFQNGHVQCR